MKLNEQIAALRKKKGITQEQLAVALGVTNQAVSKWEAGQCCPDIGLLPDIARYFGVSIDELMGVEMKKKEDGSTSETNMYDVLEKTPMLIGALNIAADNGGVGTAMLQRRLSVGFGQAKALVEQLIELGYLEEQSNNGFHRTTFKNGVPGRLAHKMQAHFVSKTKELPPADARRALLSVAFSGHAAYFYAKQNMNEQVDGAVEAVLGGRWGYSAISEPEFTTVMRGQSVFYSNNTALDMSGERIDRICGLLKDLSDRKCLLVLAALYDVTARDENHFASVAEVAGRAVISEADASECLATSLRSYVYERDGKYRIRGEQMVAVPILSILCH